MTEDKNMDDALDMFVESLEEEQRSDKLIEDNSKRRVNKKKDEVEINGLEKIKSILKKSIELICIGEEVKISTDPGELKLSVHGSDLGIAIGKDGKNIQALEYIINLIGKRKKLVDRNVMIDIKDYRKKRVEKIKKMALITAKKAVTEGRKITLQPMCAYERKVIHNVLAEIKNVKTRSVYEEPNRRIMIYPVRTSSK